MKKILLVTLLLLAIFTESYSQCNTAILTGASTSGNGRAPSARWRNIRAHYLITPAEMAAAGYGAGSQIDAITWAYNVAPGLVGVGELRIYLENTTNTTNLKPTDWLTAISPMVKVHEDFATSLPNVVGNFTIPFVGGIPFLYSGDGVYVAFDWVYCGTTLSTTASVFCNTALAAPIFQNVQNTTACPSVAPSTINSTSNFRPITSFTTTVVNDVKVESIYTLGEMPLSVTSNHVIQGRVTNLTGSAFTNYDVTLNITGANSFTNTQTISSLPACSSQVVTFTPFTPSATGANNVTVSIPPDNNNANNSKIVSQSITNNIFNYRYVGETSSVGVGFNAATGAVANKFNTNASITLTDVFVDFTTAGNTYKIAIYGDNVGVPSTTPLYIDATDRITTIGQSTQTLATPIVVPAGNFYVSIHQTGTINASIAYGTELPLRTNSLYFSSPAPPAAWSDLGPTNGFKTLIGAKICVPYMPSNIIGNSTVCPGSLNTYSVTPIPEATSYTWSLPSGWVGTSTTNSISVVASSISGNITCSANYICGSSVSQILAVTVYPFPTVTASANPSASVCPGSPVTLQGNGASSYTWNSIPTVTSDSTLTPAVAGTYTVVGIDGNGCSASSTINISITNVPNPVITEDSVCAPGGVVNLGATGVTVNWYDALTGGTLLNTGTAYNPSIVSTTTYYVENSTTITSAPVQAPMPGQTGTFNGNARGYWFTAPTNFTITSLQVPTTASSGNQSIAVVKFNGNTPPPVYSTTTNAFTTLFLTQNDVTPGNIIVNIPILAGEVIGILGVRGANVNSYSNTGNTTTINGFSVPLTRMGMQFPLLTTIPQSLWTEAGSSISRVDFEYTTSVAGCTSSPRIPVVATVNPLPTVTASPATQALCQNANATVIGGGASIYTWSGGITDATPFAVTSSATYTVTGTDANICSNTATAVVNMNALPTVTATPATQAICENANATVTGGGASSYAWSGGITDATPFAVTSSATYTVTGTDANLCTNTATAVVNMNALPTVTASPTTQTLCQNANATVTGGGASSYTWSGGITDATPFAVTSSATYTVTGTDANLCTNTATAVVNMNAAPTVTAGATPTTTCNNTVVTPTGSGASTYTWSGGLTDNTPFVATATATYTVTGTDGIGCSATSSVTVTVTPASGTLAPATSNQSQAHNDDFNVNYSDASCNLIATVDDGAGGNILGLTTATVNVDATAGVHNGQPFVRRWYQITPTSNGSADVILYINQADFNDYNGSVTAPYLPLPTSGNNSDPNIANIRITKNADAGLGNSPVVITPTVNWNGTYWELSFNTPSFSQFRIHSANPGNIPLPATITKFNGRKLSTSDMLTWTTASEQNNAYFNLQYATDGINFKTIAKVNSQAANGNSSSILNYSYEHMTPNLGHNYYRLEQVDIDNHATLNQQIVDLIWGSNGSTVSIYPNPTKDVLNIDLYTSKVQNTTVKVLDMSGRIIKQIQARSEVGMNQLSICLGDIASGIYTVQIFENDQLTQVSKVKKND